MASEKSALSSGVPVFTATLQEADPIRPAADINTTSLDAEPTRTRSLKRARLDPSYHHSNTSSTANVGPLGRPQSPTSPRYKGTTPPGFFAAPLTGAAAMEDERRRQEARKSQERATSENPGHRVMSSLMAGGGVGMSKPAEAPNATTTLSEGMTVAANNITVSGTTQSDEKSLISPVSTSSAGGIGSTSAQTAIEGTTLVSSPGDMTSAEGDSQNYKQSNSALLQPNQDEQPSSRAYSFPGNLLSQNERGPARGLSLPMPGQQIAPRSPSHKKHKCPYCETEFTRHHNLKSHLLTHSQEKPYVCQTCTMRFRRLHDLKRHMKLHTGERPHVCPKCDRKFARGDALARHSKGQGGCAGRRASMGGFEGDEDYEGSNAGDGEEGMDGVMYTGDPNEMSEEDRRRLSLPSIKAPHAPGGSATSDGYTHSRQPSSYPPVGPRPGQSSNNLYPPSRDRAGSSSSSNQPPIQSNVAGGHSQSNSISSTTQNQSQNTSGSMYSQSGIIESPKPLSPTAMQTHQLGHDGSVSNRQRSPSLNTQFQQQQFGRHSSARGSPPISLPSPHTSQGPRLPALNLAPPSDSRYALQTQGLSSSVGRPVGSASSNISPSTMFQPPMNSRISGPSQHQVLGGNDHNNLFAKGDNGVLVYVENLEAQVKQLNEKIQMMEDREKRSEQQIDRLSGEIYALRSQLAGQQQQHQHYPLPLPPGSMS